MKKHLRYWAVAAVGTAFALAFTSCAYDPYYSSAGGSYSSGYGDGYGYGGSNFSTSVFVSTGNPRWGYDPNCYSYYDYNRRCYYDPYLNGYYPVGYRPPVVVGCPHPYGWRPGRGYCPPPSYVRSGTVVNYRNRESAYRSSNYGWAKQVRQQPVSQGRVQDQHPSRESYDSRQSGGSRSSYNQNDYSRRSNETRPSGNKSSYQDQGRSSSYSQGVKPGIREQQGARLPSAYNTPVTRSSTRQESTGNSKARNQTRQPSQPKAQGGKQGGSRQNQPAPQRGGKEGRQEEQRGVRSLGQG